MGEVSWKCVGCDRDIPGHGICCPYCGEDKITPNEILKLKEQLTAAKSEINRLAYELDKSRDSHQRRIRELEKDNSHLGVYNGIVRNNLTEESEKLSLAVEALERECYCEKLHPDTGGKCQMCVTLLQIRGGGESLK